MSGRWPRLSSRARTRWRRRSSLKELGASDFYNLGAGTGTTVRKLVDGVGRAAGKPLTVQLASRRTGDSPALVCDNAKARAQLAWALSRDLDAILSSAWPGTAGGPQIVDCKGKNIPVIGRRIGRYVAITSGETLYLQLPL